ncbi:hypothetical protein CKA32_002326 [Geitlerinema sp. FC II]|nr:hypothetical protein CKA32_002326 [Geitlerinema sp. FC II]
MFYNFLLLPHVPKTRNYFRDSLEKIKINRKIDLYPKRTDS